MNKTMHCPAELSFTLGDRLRKSLKVAGLSRTAIAAWLDVEQGTVSSWMNDRITPRTQTLMLWAQITHVDLDWLRTGELCERTAA